MNRAIGSTFDSDAKMLTLGVNKHFSDGDVFELMLNRLKLNQDQQKPSPVVLGNSEDLYRLSGFYQTHFGDWLIKLGANVEHGDVDQSSETQSLIYSHFKYRLN